MAAFNIIQSHSGMTITTEVHLHFPSGEPMQFAKQVSGLIYLLPIYYMHNFNDNSSANTILVSNLTYKTIGTSIGAGYIPESCKEHITWALETGKDDANTHYPELEMITGEKPQYATFEDFQRYFKCKNVQRDSCNDRGLDFPLTCSFPPCDQCSIGLEGKFKIFHTTLSYC